jgi:methylated-DNA-[protein]-cysteine S-methyltransferase
MRRHCILVCVRVTRHLYDAPGFGVGEVWSRGNVIVQHELASPALEDEAERAPTASRSDPIAELCRRFAAHLEGEETTYDDVRLELDWATELQHGLAAAARRIPWGEVVSYGELAALAGRPGAARAAGSFCAGNRYALVIPCHRVVAANGIGGYGIAGPALKRRLLALEGVHL